MACLPRPNVCLVQLVQLVDQPRYRPCGDVGWLVQGEKDGGVRAKTVTLGGEYPWLAG